jgi:hypoxanthine-guanine phosphoribosyltransferase
MQQTEKRLECSRSKIDTCTTRTCEDIERWLKSIREDKCVLIPVLNGGIYYGVDVSRKLRVEHHIKPLDTNITRKTKYTLSDDFLRFHARGLEKVMSETPEMPLIILDTICDSGKCFALLKPLFQKQFPQAQLRFCCLFLRCCPKGIFDPDFSAIELYHERWLMGYGLDVLGKNRNLTEVFSIQSFKRPVTTDTIENFESGSGEED